jgi:hypothetical protein
MWTQKREIAKRIGKINFFFDIALTLEHRDCLRSSAKSKPAIQFFFYLIQLGQQTWAGPGAEGRPLLRSSEAEGDRALDPGARG